MGEYGPLVTVTRFDDAPEELEWQLPLTGELYRVMPGSDRPDYSLMVLERPLHFYPAAGFDIGRAAAEQLVEDRKGRPMVRVNALLLCARFVGQQLHAGMDDLAVNIAYVIDTSLARDAVVDFAKIEYAAIGFLSEGHVRPPGPAAPGATGEPAPAAAAVATASDTADETAAAAGPPEPEAAVEPQVEPPADGVVSEGVPPMVVVDEVVPEVARLLKEGIERQRGTRVERLTAVLRLDERHRVSGLSGNADGESPVPTPETFERINEALAPLADLPHRDPIEGLTIRLEGDRLTSEVDYGGA